MPIPHGAAKQPGEFSESTGSVDFNILAHPYAITMLYIPDGGDPMRPLELSSEDREAVVGSLMAERQEICSIDRNETGINLERIHTYREKMGAQRKTILFLDPAEYRHVLAIAGRDETSHSEGGTFLHEHDLVLVKRQPILEEQNGPELTESFAIHEITHGRTPPLTLIVKEQVSGSMFKRRRQLGVKTAAMGLLSGDTPADTRVFGHAWEEARADYERGKFVRDELGRSGGFITDPGTEADRSIVGAVPGEYWYWDLKNGERKPNVSGKAAFCAAGLGLLIQHDPTLLAVLRASGDSNEGIAALERHIDGFAPGLYERVGRIDLRGETAVVKSAEMYRTIRSALAASP
jgi:hypothetical protein